MNIQYGLLLIGLMWLGMANYGTSSTGDADALNEALAIVAIDNGLVSQNTDPNTPMIYNSDDLCVRPNRDKLLDAINDHGITLKVVNTNCGE